MTIILQTNFILIQFNWYVSSKFHCVHFFHFTFRSWKHHLLDLTFITVAPRSYIIFSFYHRALQMRMETASFVKFKFSSKEKDICQFGRGIKLGRSMILYVKVETRNHNIVVLIEMQRERASYVAFQCKLKTKSQRKMKWNERRQTNYHTVHNHGENETENYPHT